MTDDRARIRALLETDRGWAVYALGDLEPPQAAFAEWRLAPGGGALVLLYREFGVPVLFTFGPPAEVAPLVNALAEGEVYLLIRPDSLPLVEACFTVRDLTDMRRMLLDPAAFARPNGAGVARLNEGDFAALEALYADGADSHEAPDFFYRQHLERGMFCGVREGERLVAAAGTHLVSPALGLGTIGNVYVRRDRRGRGLGQLVTAAVTAELLALGLITIALNVRADNVVAMRVYEKLGFRHYCSFYEGVAVRR